MFGCLQIIALYIKLLLYYSVLVCNMQYCLSSYLLDSSLHIYVIYVIEFYVIFCVKENYEGFVRTGEKRTIKFLFIPEGIFLPLKNKVRDGF